MEVLVGPENQPVGPHFHDVIIRDLRIHVQQTRQTSTPNSGSQSPFRTDVWHEAIGQTSARPDSTHSAVTDATTVTIRHESDDTISMVVSRETKAPDLSTDYAGLQEQNELDHPSTHKLSLTMTNNDNAHMGAGIPLMEVDGTIELKCTAVEVSSTACAGRNETTTTTESLNPPGMICLLPARLPGTNKSANERRQLTESILTTIARAQSNQTSFEQCPPGCVNDFTNQCGLLKIPTTAGENPLTLICSAKPIDNSHYPCPVDATTTKVVSATTHSFLQTETEPPIPTANSEFPSSSSGRPDVTSVPFSDASTTLNIRGTSVKTMPMFTQIGAPQIVTDETAPTEQYVQTYTTSVSTEDHINIDCNNSTQDRTTLKEIILPNIPSSSTPVTEKAVTTGTVPTEHDNNTAASQNMAETHTPDVMLTQSTKQATTTNITPTYGNATLEYNCLTTELTQKIGKDFESNKTVQLTEAFTNTGGQSSKKPGQTTAKASSNLLLTVVPTSTGISEKAIGNQQTAINVTESDEKLPSLPRAIVNPDSSFSTKTHITLSSVGSTLRSLRPSPTSLPESTPTISTDGLTVRCQSHAIKAVPILGASVFGPYTSMVLVVTIILTFAIICLMLNWVFCACYHRFYRKRLCTYSMKRWTEGDRSSHREHVPVYGMPFELNCRDNAASYSVPPIRTTSVGPSYQSAGRPNVISLDPQSRACCVASVSSQTKTATEKYNPGQYVVLQSNRNITTSRYGMPRFPNLYSSVDSEHKVKASDDLHVCAATDANSSALDSSITDPGQPDMSASDYNVSTFLCAGRIPDDHPDNPFA